jgi:formylglycine-generating enzyme required for sulfatase activity
MAADDLQSGNKHSEDVVVSTLPKACCAPSAARAAESTCCGAVPATDASGSPLFKKDVSEADARRPMVSLPGGAFLMGTDYPGGFPADGEGPVRPVILSPFAIDVFPVTNEDFSAFVSATGYRTEAEKFGWSFVFWSHIPQKRFQKLVEDTVAAAPWWCKVSGACWNHPEGPGSHIDGRQNSPAAHVSWNDAASYAEWAGKSLPTEAQWEYAARGGLEQKLYPWGDELTPDGKHLCNIWQGRFPTRDTGEDGYTGPSPVDAFPPNGYGLYSVTGNVWEWCADWFQTKFSADPAAHDPAGPANGKKKVMKGGSFLCHASYCNRYRVGARTQNTPDSSTANIGFRCVKSLSR